MTNTKTIREVEGSVQADAYFVENFEPKSSHAIEPNTEHNIVVEGMLMPKNKISKNDVLYDWESVKNMHKDAIGKKVFYNHIVDTEIPPTGKVIDSWIVESGDNPGWYYAAQISKKSDYAQSIREGNLDKVSLQIRASKATKEKTENGRSYTKAFVSSLKEVSLVGCPGFEETTLAMTLQEAFNESEQQTTKNNPTQTKGVGTKTKDDDEEETPSVVEVKVREDVDLDSLGEDENPCWDGYVMIGTKTQNGREVPRCVPKDSTERQRKQDQKLREELDTLRNKIRQN